jgi:carboxylesterase
MYAFALPFLQLIAGVPDRSLATDDYSRAVTRAEARQAADDSVVATGARSILLVHGARTARVYLLLHGFTDSPTQFAPLGDKLFATGDNVFIPRLPHHAEREGRVRALGKLSAIELEAFGDSVYDVARGLGDSVIVVGLSAGGNVAGSIAQHHDVFRAVLIAPAIAAGRVSEDGARTLVAVGAVLPNITRSDAPDSTRPDFIQGISTRGLASVLRLGEMLRNEAGSKSAQASQIVFLMNQNDRTVSQDAAIDLARRWTKGKPLVSVYQFPGQLGLGHNVLESAERGGSPGLVLPVIEALARGLRVPDTVQYQFIVSDWNRPRP